MIIVDPDGSADRHRAAATRRDLTLRAQPDAMATLSAYLTADGAVKIYQLSDLLASSTAGTAGDTRGIGARRIDAWVDIADQLMTHGFLDLADFIGHLVPDSTTPSAPGATGDSVPGTPNDPKKPTGTPDSEAADKTNTTGTTNMVGLTDTADANTAANANIATNAHDAARAVDPEPKPQSEPLDRHGRSLRSDQPPESPPTPEHSPTAPPRNSAMKSPRYWAPANSRPAGSPSGAATSTTANPSTTSTPKTADGPPKRTLDLFAAGTI